MLNLLKKLFRKEEKIEEINFSNLDTWISEKSKPVIDEFNRNIQYVVEAFNYKMKKITGDLDYLKNSQLSNPNIPQKAKQYMEGNREFYTNAVSSWTKSISIEPTKESLQNLVVEFDKKLDELNKSTIRSYTILQEFFANESGKIAEGIKELNANVKKISGILSSEKILMLEKLTSELGKIKSGIEQKEKLLQLLEDQKSKTERAKEEHAKLSRETEEFKQSEEFIESNALRNEKAALVREMDNYEDRLIQSMAIIERALRKYSHIAFEHEEIVLDYLNSPLKTLSEDKNFTLIEILKKMEEMVSNGTIKLDESKKSKTLDELKKLDEAFVRKCFTAYENLMQKVAEIDKVLREIDVANKLSGLNAKLANSELIIRNLENGASKMKSSIERIDINFMIKSLEENVIGFVGRPVVIKV